MKITWLELYNWLYRKANNINNLGNFDWNELITVIDADGREYVLEPNINSVKPSVLLKLIDKEE